MIKKILLGKNIDKKKGELKKEFWLVKEKDGELKLFSSPEGLFDLHIENFHIWKSNKENEKCNECKFKLLCGKKFGSTSEIITKFLNDNCEEILLFFNSKKNFLDLSKRRKNESRNNKKK